MAAAERIRPTTDDERRQSLPAGRVLGAGLLALVAAALLNADALVRDAEAKEIGSTGRDVSLAVWRPAQRLAGLLQLDVPRSVGDLALGRELDDTDFELPVAETIAAADEPAEAAPPTWRTPTVDDPLDVWVGGDSMSQVFGQSLMRIATGIRVVRPEQDTRISTGLSRPDFYDWPARLDEVADDRDPDVMVIMFGANDAQGLVTADGTAAFGEQRWIDDYRRRVAGVMDLLAADPERLVVWVGQPSARDGELARRMELINGIFRDEAVGRAGVVYLESWDLLNGTDGRFAPVLADDSGELVSMRQDDGFHLTRSGGDRLAIAVLREVSSRFDLTGASGGVAAIGSAG